MTKKLWIINCYRILLTKYSMSTSAEDSLQQTDRMVFRQCKWNSLSEANDQSITSTWVVKKSIRFIYFHRQQSSTGDWTRGQQTKTAFTKQLNTTTDRGLFWDQTVYLMYISYINNTPDYNILQTKYYKHGWNNETNKIVNGLGGMENTTFLEATNNFCCLLACLITNNTCTDT